MRSRSGETSFMYQFGGYEKACTLHSLYIHTLGQIAVGETVSSQCYILFFVVVTCFHNLSTPSFMPDECQVSVLSIHHHC